jgi:hypothetical protein
MDQERSVTTEGERPQGDGTTVSAGEGGTADDSGDAGPEVVIGEIPAADEPTVMLWTARCSHPDHGLLGHFRTRADAEKVRTEHIESAHGGAAI